MTLPALLFTSSGLQCGSIYISNVCCNSCAIVDTSKHCARNLLFIPKNFAIFT